MVTGTELNVTALSLDQSQLRSRSRDLTAGQSRAAIWSRDGPEGGACVFPMTGVLFVQEESPVSDRELSWLPITIDIRHSNRHSYTTVTAKSGLKTLR